MSKRNKGNYGQLGRLAILAFGVIAWGWMIWSISAYQAANTYQAQQAASQERDNTPSRIKEACVNREGAALTQCIKETVEASRESERAEYDLNAQSQMAFWAMLMFWAAALTAGVTLVGVWFVKRTLEATLQAVEDTSEATDAMQKANQIAANAQRAWLHCQLSPTTNIEFADGGAAFNYIFQLKNVGNSPCLFAILQIADHDFVNGIGQAACNFRKKVAEKTAEPINEEGWWGVLVPDAVYTVKEKWNTSIVRLFNERSAIFPAFEYIVIYQTVGSGTVHITAGVDLVCKDRGNALALHFQDQGDVPRESIIVSPLYGAHYLT